MKHLALAKRIALMLALVMLVQTVGPAAALGRAGAAPQTQVTIPDGTELSVVTTEEISSKTAAEGDPVNFKVDEDLVINGHVVIAKGTMAKGVISNASKSGRMGKGGKLSIRVESTTTVDEQKIRLRAAKGKEGDDKTGSVIALSLLVSPLFLLKKGKDAKVKEGTKIKVYTDEEKKVTPKS